ncbi:MAG: 4Fe-4S dicluster domain-containing protein [Candidatus Helarchaeota archaeon]
MPGEDTSKIILHEENCTGCRICQFICSFTYFKKFIPEKAHIQVVTHKIPPVISFRDSCTHCLKCVNHCLYGALELMEGGQ